MRHIWDAIEKMCSMEANFNSSCICQNAIYTEEMSISSSGQTKKNLKRIGDLKVESYIGVQSILCKNIFS